MSRVWQRRHVAGQADDSSERMEMKGKEQPLNKPGKRGSLDAANTVGITEHNKKTKERTLDASQNY